MRYHVVDVFTSERFGGNPLAVVIDDRGLDPVVMQQIAQEFGFSETIFIAQAVHHASQDPGDPLGVRIFTPVAELPFAGHPLVGAAFILAAERRGGAFEDGDGPAGPVFATRAGVVPMRLLVHAGTVTGAWLRAPQAYAEGPGPSLERVAQCCRLLPMGLAEGPAVLASAGIPFVVVEAAGLGWLDDAAPDGRALRDLGEDLGTGVLLFARDRDDVERLHARMFTPLVNRLEDPATGSANAALGGYLALRSGSDVRVTVEQGTRMGRPSVLHVQATHAQTGIVCEVGGQCVRVAEGTLDLS